MKADELVARLTSQVAKQADSATPSTRMPASLNDKGLMIDKQA